MKEMVDSKNQLCALGLNGWIHPDYELLVRGEKKEIMDRLGKGSSEHAAVKRDNDYIRVHYKHICESDAVLIVNLEKNGIKNYIGGNVLMEMSQAYVNSKKIFLLNGVPQDLPYAAEIEAMDPICLNGNLANIPKLV